MRTAVVLCALGALFIASNVQAERLMRPVSVQEARWSALRAAGVQNAWRSGHKVTQLGVTRRGHTVMMVKSKDLNKPAIISSRRATVTEGNYTYETVKSTRLSDRALQRLGLVTPAGALKIASQNGGLFGKVPGEVKFSGSANKGKAYKFTVTPDKPVNVKVPYGSYTVKELTRWVNVYGNGESAAPTGGSTFNYQPRPR